MSFKKLFVFMSFLLVFTCSFNVYAEESETNILTLGKGFSISRDINFTDTLNSGYLDKVIDNDDSTSYALPSPFYVDLKDNYSIGRFRAFIRVNRYNSTTFKMQFFSADKKLIKETRTYPAGSSLDGDTVEYKENFEVQNVRYLGIQGGATLYDLKMFGSKYVPSITNLNSVSGVNDVNFTWTNPNDKLYKGVKVFVDNKEVATVSPSDTSYKVSNLEPNKEYNFKFVSLYDLNGEIAESDTMVRKVTTLIDPKTVPPSNVTNLKVSDIKSTSVKLSWVNPTDKDLKGLRIFNGDKLVAETGIVDNFEVKDLKPKTEYEFRVVAIDNDSNLSGASTVRFTTLEFVDLEPPKAPEGLAVKQGSEALFLTWKNNTEKDLAGYNVYLDGKKVNSILVDNPFFTLRDLKNDADYKVQVSAVDKSGNESTLSSVVVGKPVSSGLPIIGTDYSLNDVTLGISEFFGSFWLIIAFAVSIPLSFYIAARVKLLFLD
ncbi:fibronectin type III domain-containing protein [Bacillus cereus]|nr:fibronectin type III domain-containing protein [Bacillus cereus]